MIIKTRLVQILTFGFANGICFFPFVLIGKEIELTDRLINHERIHFRQQLETLVLPFYVWYFMEFLIRIIQFRSFDEAYRNISFEREAYHYESYGDYLDHRKWFAWTGFISGGRPRTS